MILLLDIGNTRLKWALSAVTDSAPLREAQAIAHDGDPAAAFAANRWPAVSAVWIAHVTGEALEQRITQSVAARYGFVPRFARTPAEHDGLRLGYAEPQRLGVDRFLKMLALWREQRSAFGVASAGTALTFDAVDARGQHLGGLIAAGLTTLQRAVLGATRFPTRPAPADYRAGLGRDTESCVREGALHECLGLLERMARRHPGPRRVLTGGDAETLLPHLEGWTHRPNLVLEGLRAYACSK